MPIERVFLGWSRPLAPSAVEWLWSLRSGRPRDFSGVLVLVPTRQAGRRLRQALAQRAAADETGVIGLRVGLPRELVQPPESIAVAPPLLEQALWASLLNRIDAARFPALHLPPSPRPWRWAVQTARTIQNLRLELTEAERTFQEVARISEEQGWESDRWKALAEIEREYLEQVEKTGFTDRCRAEWTTARNPTLPSDLHHLVVIGIPDLAPLFTRALESLSTRITVSLLIHAPESEAGSFDRWGCPLPEPWESTPWTIPDWRETLIPVEEPADLGDALLRTLGEWARQFSPEGTAVGTTDPLLGGYLIEPLERRGFTVFDPSRHSLARHPLIALLASLQALALSGDYATLSQFFRQTDILHHLAHPPWSLDSARLLAELDAFQNLYLPTSLEDFTPERLEGRIRLPGFTPPAFPLLQKALDLARHVRASLSSRPAADTLLALLAEIYAHRTISDQTPEDRTWRSIVTTLVMRLSEWQTAADRLPDLSPEECHLLLSETLAAEFYTPPVQETDFTLEGWLELPWNEAPALAIVGLNDEYVPRARTSDAWLPNTLRTALGLPHDRSLAARDLFLLRTLVESRRHHGRLALYCLRKGPDGEPLKPSRLLFRGSDADLLPLAEHLLARSPKGGSRPAPRSRIRLDPCPDGPPQWPADRPLSVTAFRDYLEDPFYFYLSHVLGLEELADTKMEPDARDFGSLIHAAAQSLATLPSPAPSESVVIRHLHTAAEVWMRGRFGPSLDVAARVILEAAKNRLTALGRWQWQAFQEGWQLWACEVPLSLTIGGVLVRGRADHVAWHPATRTLRILDLKTGASRGGCMAGHLGALREDTPQWARVSDHQGRLRRWRDLQLPLYVLMWNSVQEPTADRIEVGWLRLPAQPLSSPLDLWPDLDKACLASALCCAEGVVASIRAGRFAPPARRAPMGDLYRERFGGEWETLFDLRRMEGSAP